MEKSADTGLNYCFNCMAKMGSGQRVCPVCGHDNALRFNAENALPKGSILAGKYLAGRILGQGGFGITYLGLDAYLDVKVAIKEYFPAGVAVRSTNSIRVTAISNTSKAETFRKGCDEFQKEAKRLAAIDSPFIVKVRDYFLENDTAYIVMNYLEGNSLTTELEAYGGRMPWQRVIELFKPLILEMDKVHKEHLIHRDIKPDNIKVIKEKNGTEHLVLMDFGAARSFVSAEETGMYSAMLTHGYAPIEQYSTNSRQGPYTDIYAICATMYNMITDILPPNAADRVTNGEKIKTFSELGIDIPDHTAKAIFHGLGVRGADRPQTMRELYDELCGNGSTNSEKTVAAEKPESFNKTVVMHEEVREPIKKPEKKKSLWPLPVLSAVLLAGGFFFYRSIRQNELNMLGTQTAEAGTSTQEALVLEARSTANAENTRTALTEAAVSMFAQETQTVLDQKRIELEKTEAAIHAMETNAVIEETQPAMEMQMTGFVPTMPKADEPPMPMETNTPEPFPDPTMEPIREPTREPIKVGDIITFGTYEQDNNFYNGGEPIEWQVLSVNDGRALLISKYVLDAKQYNEDYTNVTWETCTLRKWLNGEFYNSAFSSEEKKQIREIRIKNPDNAKYGTRGGNDTTDRIFLISIDEAKQLFKSEEARKCRPTNYAKNNGAFVSEKYSGTTWWWLRAPFDIGDNAACGGTDGIVYDENSYAYVNEVGSVRPAFWLDL